MSQFILDEQIDVQIVLPPLQRWTSVTTLRELRPSEVILDERVPEILLNAAKPTFVTIDQDFWDRHLCHPEYCVIYFALRDSEQELLPPLLRALVKRAEFRTRNLRMGKVARVGTAGIDYFEFMTAHVKRLDWPRQVRRKRKK